MFALLGVAAVLSGLGGFIFSTYRHSRDPGRWDEYAHNTAAQWCAGAYFLGVLVVFGTVDLYLGPTFHRTFATPGLMAVLLGAAWVAFTAEKRANAIGERRRAATRQRR